MVYFMDMIGTAMADFMADFMVAFMVDLVIIIK